MEITIRLNVNGQPVVRTVPPEMTLLRFLREELALTGAKEGCGIGECGACTVILNGRPVCSCMVLAAEADGAIVRTVEGEATLDGVTELQQAIIDHHAVQCGFCTPGMILSAQALLERNPHPTDEEILEAMAGNLCRCTGYTAILAAVRSVAARHAGGER